MAKVSRPIIYAVVLGVAAYAVVLLTEPDAPPSTKKKTMLAKGASAAPTGFTAADMNAHFDTYKGPRRDAFLPRVISKHAITPASVMLANPLAGARGTWVLTGINDIDGTRSALLENPTSGESIFLKPGDQWNGQKVASIGSTAVTLVNGAGQQAYITFPTPDDPDAAKRGGTSPASPGPTGTTAATPGAPGSVPGATGVPGAPGNPANFPAPPGFTTAANQ